MLAIKPYGKNGYSKANRKTNRKIDLEFQVNLRLMNSFEERKKDDCDPLVCDGGLDNEDVLDHVQLLPQGDLQHIHLHNEMGERGAKTKSR